MKYLLTLLLASAFSIALAQNPLPFGTGKILIGLTPDVDAEELGQMLVDAEVFLPLDERAFLKGGSMYVAWFDPQSPNAPASGAEVEAIVEGLRQESGLAFVQPFLVGLQGEELGLTNAVRVRIENGVTVGLAERLGSMVGAVAVQQDEYLGQWMHLRLPLQSPMDPIAATRLLAQHPAVELAEPDFLYPISVATNDTYYYQQWALENNGSPTQGNGTPGADMQVPDSWAITTGDPSIRIGIIDSGVDTSHPDLKDNLLPGFDATGGGSMGYPNLSYPSDAHGTNCAGIAAAKGDNNLGIAGVCYDCGIVPVKLFTYVFNPFGAPLPFATGSDMADAISWVWQTGEADLVSNSWGLTDPLLPALPNGTGIVEDALDMALDSARNGKGIPMFFSSGNDGDPPIWPGRRANLFSVNASSMCDERKSPSSCDGQNWEGNWGDSLDVTAPGVQIAATDLSGSDGYTSGDYNFEFGGTSAACPNAAGVMGLVMSVYPGLSVAEAHAILEGSCDKVGGYTYQTGFPNGTWSSEMGYGRVNAYAAVQAAALVSSEEGLLALPSFSVYPNPAISEVILTAHFPKSDQIEVTLTDLKGGMSLKLLSEKVTSRSYSKNLNLHGLRLSKGFYVLNVKTRQGVQHLKLLIDN